MKHVTSIITTDYITRNAICSCNWQSVDTCFPSRAELLAEKHKHDMLLEEQTVRRHDLTDPAYYEARSNQLFLHYA